MHLKRCSARWGYGCGLGEVGINGASQTAVALASEFPALTKFSVSSTDLQMMSLGSQNASFHTGRAEAQYC